MLGLMIEIERKTVSESVLPILMANLSRKGWKVSDTGIVYIYAKGDERIFINHMPFRKEVVLSRHVHV
jgi:hypothetical protein